MYRVFGHWVEADISLPGLLATALPPATSADFFLCCTEPPPVPPTPLFVHYTSAGLDDQGRPFLVIRKTSDGSCYWLQYIDGTAFVFDASARRLWATWPPSLTLEDAAAYLLGPVFGIILHLLGKHPLHGSSVVIAGMAAVFVGGPGAGKSTTAAAFARAGHPVLADDIILLDDGTPPQVLPAYPGIRLWPGSVEKLYGSSDALPWLSPTWDKRRMDLTEGDRRFQQSPVPLGAIYLFADRTDDARAPWIEPIAGADAILRMVANTYATNLLDAAARASEFQYLSRLVAAVPVRLLHPHLDFERMPHMRELIVADLESLPALAPARG